jgi:prolyl 4-hydroxylase
MKRKGAILPRMSIMDEVERLARSGRPGEGVALVEQSAGAGDAESLFILANWRLWGLNGPKDLPRALELVERADEAGWPEAALLRATLTANGTGGPSDPLRARDILQRRADADTSAAEQLRLFDRMEGHRIEDVETLSSDPDIRLARGFLTREECDYLIRIATPRMRASMILDEKTGKPRPHPVRTSSSMNFGPSDENLVVHAINRRIALLSETDVRSGEPLHILRYASGQEFRPHLDAVAGATNQRQWTALIYLNDAFEGGNTVFPSIGISTRGNSGDCLLFRVCDDEGRTDQRLRHAGEPVTNGIKWLASRWIRQRPYMPEILSR